MNTNELLEKKGNLVTQADEILKRAKEDGRYDLTAEENTRFDAIHADIEKITAFVEKEQRMASLAEGTGRRTEQVIITDSTRSTSHGIPSDRDRVDALRAWSLAGQSDAQISEEQRNAARRCGINLASNQITLSLFGPKAMRATNLRSLSQEDVQRWQGETRAALTGAQSTTTTGGYTVADSMMQGLEESLLAFGGMRQVATILRTATGGPLPIPTTNDTAQ
jgi:HK97 family phage major capsid protein